LVGGGSTGGGGGSVTYPTVTQPDGTKITTMISTASDGTVTKTETAVRKGSKNEIVIETKTTPNGTSTVSASVDVKDSSGKISSDGKVKVTADISDDIAKAKALLRQRGERNATVDVVIDDTVVTKRVNNEKVDNIRIDVIGGYSNSVGSVKINKAAVDAASEAGKDLEVFVTNNNGRQRAKFTVPATGKKLNRDLDLSVDISLASNNQNIDTKGGVVISFGTGKKPAGTEALVSLSGFLNSNSGLKAGQTIYGYRVGADDICGNYENKQ